MNKEIELQIEDIIKGINDYTKKEIVKIFFTEDAVQYLKKMEGLESLILNNKISEEKAYTTYSLHSDWIIKRMGKIEEIIDRKDTLKKIKQTFRKQADDFIHKVFLMRWGHDKPSGHPGDFKLIEIIYNNKTSTKDFSSCGDKYLLGDSYIEAIRIRKDIMKSMLVDFIKNSKAKKLNIMNLGCGGCREIRELLESNQLPSNKELTFTLIDWDKEAIEFSKEALNTYSHPSIKFNFAQENVVGLHKIPEKYFKIFGKQDLIYSIGLVDYLPNLVLGQIIKFCFNLLNESGELILAHKNVKIHKSIASDWFCDWSFFPRSKEDMRSIIDEALNEYKYEIKISEDTTEHLFFIDLTVR